MSDDSKLRFVIRDRVRIVPVYAFSEEEALAIFIKAHHAPIGDMVHVNCLGNSFGNGKSKEVRVLTYSVKDGWKHIATEGRKTLKRPNN